MKKRLMACVLLVVMLLMLLTACGKKTFSCDLCGRTVTEKPHNVEILGEKAQICADCYKDYKELKDGADELVNAFG